MDPGSLAANLLGCAGPGVAFIDSPAHPTYQIIRSFLDDTNQWQFIGTSPALNPQLAVEGGVYVALKGADDTFPKDVSSVTFDNGAGQLSPGPSALLRSTCLQARNNFGLNNAAHTVKFHMNGSGGRVSSAGV